MLFNKGVSQPSNPRYKTYRAWCDMKARCHRKTHSDYKMYGAKGIMVCKKWRDFRNFFNDMGEKPAGKSIDRINPNGSYSKKNCRWSTPQQQMANRRPNKGRRFKGVIEIKRKTKPTVWMACVKKDGKCYHLRYFDTIEDAARAYDEKAAELFGEYANLNFPPEPNKRKF